MANMGSLSGRIRIAVESADLPGLLSALNGRGILLLSAVVQDDVTCVMEIRRGDWRTFSSLCHARGEKITILKRSGLYWHIKQMGSRPIMILGMILLLWLVLYLPSRVLFIRVEGCRDVPTLQVLEAAERCGIRFGASRRAVRSERVKNALLEMLPQLQWAGVNTKGCVAILSVQERRTETGQTADGFISAIVAARDGIITSCTATKGNLLCAPGQAVQKDQILISGFTDCGLSILATSAEGEIFAQTRQYAAGITPSEYQYQVAEEGLYRNFSLLLGKKRINLWKDSGIWDTSCGRIYSEYYVTLPGGLVLPLGIAVEEFTEYRWKVAEVSQEDGAAVLEEALPEYLTSRMIAGQIQSRKENLSSEPGIYKLAGEYVCTEMIGRVQREQIGE